MVINTHRAIECIAIGYKGFIASMYVRSSDVVHGDKNPPLTTL